MLLTEYADHLCELHGESVSMTRAARILDRSTHTIRVMMDDGRLQSCCGDEKRVLVRSIAEYMLTPAANDRTVRLDKKREKRGVTCAYRV